MSHSSNSNNDDTRMLINDRSSSSSSDYKSAYGDGYEMKPIVSSTVTKPSASEEPVHVTEIHQKDEETVIDRLSPNHQELNELHVDDEINPEVTETKVDLPDEALNNRSDLDISSSAKRDEKAAERGESPSRLNEPSAVPNKSLSGLNKLPIEVQIRKVTQYRGERTAEQIEKSRRHWAILRAHVVKKRKAKFSFGILQDGDDDTPKQDKSSFNPNPDDDVDDLLTPDSGTLYIRTVIPYLPRGTAVLCLILNLAIPGSGTILSGIVAAAGCGRPRVERREGRIGTTLCVNIAVGIMQLCTVPFLLVGYIWSLVWGIYFIILAVEYRNAQIARRERDVKATVAVVFNKNLRIWQLG